MDRIPTTNGARLRRAGSAAHVVVVVLLVVLILPLVAWRLLPGGSFSSSGDVPMLHVVERGNFIHDITERGAVESASNTEVRCEVQAQNSAGTRILEVVPEGTNVKTGDVICRLDSSALENDRLKQTSVVENANAAKIQAESDHETAKKALDEYVEGKYKIDRAQIDADLAVAEETERRALDTVRYSTQLLEKGYITALQLEADKFAAKKATTDSEAAKLRLKVLDEYTKEKTKVQLNADIKSTAAKLEAAVNTWSLEKERLNLIVKQIEKCTIRAPANGQVVYANNTERWGGQEIIIEEGALVRERQVIVRLPDPKRMQVKARINESKIALVQENQTAVIRLDALPDQDLQGIVRKVSEYPVQGGWWAANIKEYETTIEILGSPEGLRPGLNAEARIRVAQIPEVVQVPVQAVAAQGDKHYCFVRKNDDWELRELDLGSANDKMIVVKTNLEPGETVALNAASLRDEYELPDVPAAPEAKILLAANDSSAVPGGKADAKPAVKPADGAVASVQGGPAEKGKRGAGPPQPAKSDSVAVATQQFQELDKDGDGRLAKKDLPEPMQSRFAAMDKNGDGAIDRQEWLAAARTVAATGDDRKPRTRGG